MFRNAHENTCNPQKIHQKKIRFKIQILLYKILMFWTRFKKYFKVDNALKWYQGLCLDMGRMTPFVANELFFLKLTHSILG